MRISLRELMLVVAVAALGLAGLKYADGTMFMFSQAMAGLVLMALLVRAVVDRGREQAFAIGFVLCALTYLAASVANVSVGLLGTDRLSYDLYSKIASDHWYDEATGKLAVNFVPKTPQAQGAKRVELTDWKPDENPPIAKSDEKVTPPENNASTPDTGEATTSARGRGGRSQFGGDTSGFGGSSGFGDGSTFGGSDQSGFAGARGGGRGRGRGRGSISSMLTPQQNDEYLSDEFSPNRSMLGDLLNMPEGLAAIQTGRPLSTIRLVTYVRRTTPTYESYNVVSRSLWMLLIGYVGGLFARFVYSRRKERTSG